MDRVHLDTAAPTDLVDRLVQVGRGFADAWEGTIANAAIVQPGG